MLFRTSIPASVVAAMGLLFLVGTTVPSEAFAQDASTARSTTGLAQAEADTSGPSSSADFVSVETRLAATPVPAGQAVDGALVLEVEEGWHVNAHRPTFDYLIGTTLDWEKVADVSVANVRYPTPERFELDFAGDAIDVYQGTAPIFFDVRPTSAAAPGERRLTGRLRVQACNDRTCLQPSTVTAALSVPVAGAEASSTPTNDPIFEEGRSPSTWSTIVPILRKHGPFIAGGLLALGTVLFLVVYSWVSPRTADE